MLVFSKVPLFFLLYSTQFFSPIPKSISTAFDPSTLFPARCLFQAPDLDIYLLVRYFQSFTFLKLTSSLSYLRFLCSWNGTITSSAMSKTWGSFSHSSSPAMTSKSLCLEFSSHWPQYYELLKGRNVECLYFYFLSPVPSTWQSCKNY